MLTEAKVTQGLREIAKGDAQRRYFFERAQSPDWLQPLVEAGYFRTPPPPEVTDKYISFPIWEQTRFLARLATIPSAQAAVFEIASRIPPTENVRVHEDLLDIAIALPDHLSVTFVAKICEWVTSPYKLGLADKISAFLVHLADRGQVEAALELACNVLAPQSDPRFPKRIDKDILGAEASSFFAEYDFKDIVENSLSPLTRAAGPRAVKLFGNLLENAIALTRGPSPADGEEDYLYISQEDLTAKPNSAGVTNLLLWATTRSATEAISRARDDFGLIIEGLKSHRWISFRRIVLHLSATFPDLSVDESVKQLTDTEVLSHPSTAFEAKSLLKEIFHKLPLPAQQSILQWIEDGPDRGAVEKWLESTSAQEVDEFCDRWRRDILAIIETSLSPVWRRRLHEQIKLLGEPNPIDRPRHSFAAFGPESPVTVDDLSLLSSMQVIDYLRTWKPTGKLFEATPEGLGRTLTTLVSQRPDEYALVAHEFHTLDPTYVRAYIQGLEENKAGRGFRWDTVLNLASWVVNQPRIIEGREGAFMDRDPDWGWTRQAILRLLSKLIKGDEEGIQLSCREKVWGTLYPLTQDPDPTPEDDVKYEGGNMAPATIALNTVRGDAFNCLFAYVGWVQKITLRFCPEGGRPLRSFRFMPEVRDVLDSHLDTMIEPSLAIHSAYGKWLHQLAGTDWQWTIDSLPKIFPEGDSGAARRITAWESFVVYNDPNILLLQKLLPQYHAAIDRGSSVEDGTKHPAPPAHRLGEHLAMLYWRGEIELDGPDDLIGHFFRQASADSRRHFIRYIGESASLWKGEIPPIVFDRLRDLLEFRLGKARNSESPSESVPELSEFGSWFVSERFDDRWSLTRLAAILDLVGKIGSQRTVAKKLAELASAFPKESVKALAQMIKRTDEKWLIHVIGESAKHILNVAIQSGDPEASFIGRKLREELISEQHFEFRNI